MEKRNNFVSVKHLGAFLVFSVLLFGFKKSEPDIRPAVLLSQMQDSISAIRTLRMKIAAVERIERKFITATSEIKLQTNPRKVYFVNRVKKLEILFNTEQLGDKALVKPHIFPYMTVSLDPRGNLMRKNQHYTIHELGYDFIGRSLLLTLKKDPDGVRNFSYLGQHMLNGYHCYLLQYENKSFSYVNYVVGERETATSIAYKLCVNDYLLRYHNNLLNEFDFLKKGTVLKIPNLYCKKAVIYLDERLMLPVSVSLYDDQGLFESYEFTAIVVNKPIRSEEFTRNYRDYKF